MPCDPTRKQIKPELSSSESLLSDDCTFVAAPAACPQLGEGRVNARWSRYCQDCPRALEPGVIKIGTKSILEPIDEYFKFKFKRSLQPEMDRKDKADR